MRIPSKKSKVILLHSTLFSALIVKKKKVHRRYKIRPFLRNRQSSGQFEQMFLSMKSNEKEFFGYTRMSPKVFQYLLSLIEQDLQKDPRGAPLSPELRLAVTLHFLAEGLSMTEIARNYYIGKSTTHYMIRQTCDAIWKNLMPIFLPPPNTKSVQEDCRRILEKVEHSKLHWSLRCLVLMTTCDACYKFVMVDIGAQGSCHDNSVLGQSTFGHALFENELPIPDSKNLPHSNIIFNYRISRARRTIENTFGTLVQRWRVLRGPIVADIKNSKAITQELPIEEMRYCTTGFVDVEREDGEIIMGRWKQADVLRPVGRMGFQYFNSPTGMLPYQENIILRGSIPSRQ